MTKLKLIAVCVISTMGILCACIVEDGVETDVEPVTIAVDEKEIISETDEMETSIPTESETETSYPLAEDGKYYIEEQYWWKDGINVYMDEVSSSTTRNQFCWSQDFSNRDYDMDGIDDRVRMTRENGSTYYYVEFGNGDLLTLGPFWDPTMGFYLNSGDLTGDGVPEMFFMGFHVKVGRYFSEFIIAQKMGNEYVHMELPKSSVISSSIDPDTGKLRKEHAMGCDIFVLDVSGDRVLLGNLEEGVEAWMTIPEEKISDYRDYLRWGEVYGYNALLADIASYEDKNAVKMYIDYYSRYDKVVNVYIEIVITYEDGEWVAQSTKIQDWDYWEENFWWWLAE